MCACNKMFVNTNSFNSNCFIQVTLVSRGVGSVTTNMQLKLATRITSAGCLLLRAIGSGVSGAIAPPPPNQLTLSQPGRQIIPTTLLLIPRIFRPAYGPVSTYSLNCGLIILEKFISPVLQISLQIWFSSVLPVVHCKSRRVQWYFVTKIVLTYCEKKLF